MDQLEADIIHYRPVLVIIDTLAAAKSGALDENAAGPMADLLNAVQRLAQRESMAIIIVHHHRKGATDDIGDAMRGSTAISAAADVNIAIFKDHDRVTLKAEGRDIEEKDLRIEFEDFRWKLRGDAYELAKTEANEEVLEALSRLGESDAGTVAREIGWNRTVAWRRLKDLELNKRVASRVERVGSSIRILYRVSGYAGEWETGEQGEQQERG
jgi:RecA-family ATPase